MGRWKERQPPLPVRMAPWSGPPLLPFWCRWTRRGRGGRFGWITFVNKIRRDLGEDRLEVFMVEWTGRGRCHHNLGDQESVR